MGVRVTFYLGAPDGLEGLFWGSSPASFHAWARQTSEEFPGAYSPEFLDRLDRIVAEGPTSLSPSDRRDAELIDAIFDSFVGEYCDQSAGSLLSDASDRVVYKRWYIQAQPRIQAGCSLRTARCWGFLLQGRPVGRPPAPHPYMPSDPVFRLGYWTADEVREIHDDLRASFPSIAEREKLRTQGRFVLTPDDQVAIEIAAEATSRALSRRTGLITTVA